MYVSMPLRGPEAADGRDVVRGARLALADAREGRGSSRCVPSTSTTRVGAAPALAGARRSPPPTPAMRRRTRPRSPIVGDFDSGATRVSLPITNEARMLQVSPASAAVDLVQPFLGAGDQVPEEVQATGERTFGRVIPSDAVQAEAAAGWAMRLGARRVGTVSDGSEFGQTMVRAFRQSLPRARLTLSRPDLLYYGGGPERMPASLSRASPVTVMASDALLPHGSGESGAPRHLGRPGSLAAAAGRAAVRSRLRGTLWARARALRRLRLRGDGGSARLDPARRRSGRRPRRRRRRLLRDAGSRLGARHLLDRRGGGYDARPAGRIPARGRPSTTSRLRYGCPDPVVSPGEGLSAPAPARGGGTRSRHPRPVLERRAGRRPRPRPARRRTSPSARASAPERLPGGPAPVRAPSRTPCS